jgi:hypothetical protein
MLSNSFKWKHYAGEIILGSVTKIIFLYFETIDVSFKCHFNPNLITQNALL